MRACKSTVSASSDGFETRQAPSRVFQQQMFNVPTNQACLVVSHCARKVSFRLFSFRRSGFHCDTKSSPRAIYRAFATTSLLTHPYDKIPESSEVNRAHGSNSGKQQKVTSAAHHKINSLLVPRLGPSVQGVFHKRASSITRTSGP